MGVTDELRRACNGGIANCVAIDKQDFERICDYIDIEYEALSIDNRRMMAELDTSMPLPLDMDGEPIRIGDEMQWIDGTKFTVAGIGKHELYYYNDETHALEWTGIEHKRHYAPDTWERVIEDALCMPVHTELDVERLVARCKALAGAE